MNVNEIKNSIIGAEFDRYVREHTEFLDKIPNNALIILLLEGDEDFNEWSTRIGKKNAEDDQPIVYVTIKKMAPPRSRIEDLEMAAHM